MKNILFVTNGFPTEINPEYCVFTKEQIESVKDSGEFKTNFYFINAREEGVLSYVRAIPPLLKKIKKADVVHSFHGLTFLLVFTLSPSKKIIVSFLNSIENEYGEKKWLSIILIAITRLFIKRKNVFKIFKDKVPKGMEENSFYLPNGVDLKRFYPLDRNEARKKLGLDLNKIYILFVSSKNQYRPQKRYDKFRQVIEILQKQSFDVEELILVNEPRDKIIYYFNAANLHLLTSDFEGSPNSIKESLACNTPVVATASGNVEDMLIGLYNCYISHSFQVKELADYAIKVITSVNRQESLLSEHLKLKNLDMKGKADELIQIYKEVISK